jgi:hypothetical protein
MRKFLEHANIFGTCLTLNFVGKSTFQEFVFIKSFVMWGSVASMDIPAPLGKGAVRPTV